MGDPRKARKQYETPAHPWNLAAIEAEKIIKREYGLLRKKEIYKMSSFLKKYRAIAKRLSVDDSAQALKEAKDVLRKLNELGLVSSNAHISDILSLELKDVLERRLQSVVCRKNLARSMKQARQFITHRHILVGDKEITSPSFLLTTVQESVVTFKAKSALANESHPERADPNAQIKEEAAKLKEEMAKAKHAPKKEEAAAPAKAKAEVAKPEEKKSESKEEAKAEEVKEETKAEEKSAEKETPAEVKA